MGAIVSQLATATFSSLAESQKMESLWEARWNQDVEACIAELPWLQSCVRGQQIYLQLEARLLLGSLHRARGDMKGFEDELLKIEKSYDDQQLMSSRHFSYEKGIAAYLKENYLAALEHYVTFRSRSVRDAEVAATLMNEVFCLEALGYSFEKTLIKLDQILNQNRGNYQSPFPAIRAQRRFFDYGIKLRQGDLSFARDDLKDSIVRFDQSRYLALWVSQLPWCNRVAQFAVHDADLKASLMDAVQTNPFLHLKNERIKTLSVQPSPVRSSLDLRVSGVAERIYLWVWAWIENPNPRTGQAVLNALSLIHAKYDVNRASRSDRDLVGNAIEWISLLCPTFYVSNRSWIESKVEPSHYPLFEFERLLIHELREQQQNSDYIQATREIVSNHVLYPVFGPVADWVRQLLEKTVTDENHSARYRIDLESNLIIKKNSEIISESICRLMRGLHTAEQLGSRSITIADLMLDAFGIRKYDSLIHQSKLNNLLSKTRDFFGKAVQLQIRGNRILFNVDWRWFELQSESVHSRVLTSSPLWFKWQMSEGVSDPLSNSSTALTNTKKFVKDVKSSSSIRLKIEVEPGQEFTREQIAKILGGSKSTLLRRVNEMIKMGKMSRKGKGKSTVYFFNQEKGMHYEKQES
jgi:hypothetical protein